MPNPKEALAKAMELIKARKKKPVEPDPQIMQNEAKKRAVKSLKDTDMDQM